MNVVIALVIFIIGGISGFFANRLLSSTSQEQRKLADQVNKSEAALDQYKLDVAEHLDSQPSYSTKWMTRVKQLWKQMQESTQLLQKATTVETDGMPFFSAETQQQLAQTATLRHQKRDNDTAEAITEAPLDYSGNPSGLFADQKQKVTTAV